MIKKAVVFAAVLGSLAAIASAAPVRFCKDGVHSGNPAINLVTTGCISANGDGFYSNTGGGDPEAKVEQAILHATGSVVDLMLYGKSDSNPGLFTFSPTDPSTATSGTWSVNDLTLIYYITIKSGNGYALYEMSPASASGTFTTLGIDPTKLKEVSHISFWKLMDPGGPPVPEPGTLFAVAGALTVLAGVKLRKQRG
ncbi:MAG: PEP-CTERM sorting domain-containing protein [Acidobacteria bacterium]|nr:PEP-CTERM sorting domain-containing protein [Acidobacteriota bacterium]